MYQTGKRSGEVQWSGICQHCENAAALFIMLSTATKAYLETAACTVKTVCSTASLQIYETRKLERCLKVDGIGVCAHGTTNLWREMKPDTHAPKSVVSRHKLSFWS